MEKGYRIPETQDIWDPDQIYPRWFRRVRERTE
jgi:hypothetical protein